MNRNQTDAGLALARNVVAINYESIPTEVVTVTKKDILDLLGVALAGSTRGMGCKEVVDIVKEGGGRKESTILGFGGKVPAWMAAFANAAMAHALDYDSYLAEGASHGSITTVPAAFAVSERLGNVSGKEFITAVALGNDVLYRIALAAYGCSHNIKMNWTGCVFGGFGAAASSAKLLKLNNDKVADAFGIVIHQAGGTMEMTYSTGSAIRGIYASFPAKAGVLAALMAMKGINGSKNSLEGKGGFFNAYFNGNYEQTLLTDDLGKRFEGINVTFKPWPCCGGCHNHIDATLKIVREHDVNPENVEEITAYIGSEFQQGLCQPLEARQKPQTIVDAQFSIPFMIATAIVKQKVTLSELTPEALQDHKVLLVSQRVVPRFTPQLIGPLRNIAPGKMEIKMKNGAVYSEQVNVPPGHPQNPMSITDIADKFKDCASYAAKPLHEENVDKIIEAIINLEKEENVSRVIQLLT